MVIEKKIALRGRERGRKVFSCPCFSGFVFTSGRSSSPQRGAGTYVLLPGGNVLQEKLVAAELSLIIRYQHVSAHVQPRSLWK